MGFMNEARKAQEAGHKADEERGSRFGANRIYPVKLEEGDRLSLRILDADGVSDADGQLVRCGNPARVALTKIWKNNKPEHVFLNSTTFGRENVLDPARDEWFKAERQRLPKGTKIDPKNCTVPGTSERYLLWGLVTAHVPKDDPPKYSPLGLRYFDMGGDTFKSLMATLRQASGKCEECSRGLTVQAVSCASCATVLIGSNDVKSWSQDDLLAADEVGLPGQDLKACPTCSASLEVPLKLHKHCTKCNQPRQGLSHTTHNILITRTGEKAYGFDVDLESGNALDNLPEEVLADLDKEVIIAWDPNTKTTSTNLAFIDGVSEAKLVGYGKPAREAKPPSSPLASRATGTAGK